MNDRGLVGCMRTGLSINTATGCQNGNCFPKSTEQAHEKHGCKSEMVQKIWGRRGAPCEMYEIVLPSLGASFGRGRNQTAGQLRMSAMLRHEERARRFFLGAERRLL